MGGTGNTPEHPGPVLPDNVLWGDSGHSVRDTPSVFTQKTFAPLLGGLSCPFPNRASEVAGVTVSKHPCDFRYVQILFHQKLNRPLSPGTFEHLRKTRPLFHQTTLDRSGAHAHRFGHALQAGTGGLRRAPDGAFYCPNIRGNLVLDQGCTIGGLAVSLLVLPIRAQFFGPNTTCLAKAVSGAI